MSDKTRNTTAFTVFGNATATSANGNNSESHPNVVSTVHINIDLSELAKLITKGKELLQEKFLEASNGKLIFFKSSGKELLKEHPDLLEGFEKAIRINQYSVLFEKADKKQEASHECVINAVQNGVSFLEMVLDSQQKK